MTVVGGVDREASEKLAQWLDGRVGPRTGDRVRALLAALAAAEQRATELHELWTHAQSVIGRMDQINDETNDAFLAAEQRADTLAAAIADEKLIRTAINDPGQFLPRGDNYREPIGAWGARAVVAALSSRPVQPDTERSET